MFSGMGLETPAADLACLLQLAGEARRGAGDLGAVEVGSWAGRTALVLSEVFSQVYCVDHWGGNPADPSWTGDMVHDDQAFRTFCRNMGSRLYRSVIPCWGCSDDYAAVFPFRVAMVFLDGDHRYESVAEDIRLWWPHVFPGGILCGHDYGGFPGVTQAVDEAFGARVRTGGHCMWWVEVPG